MAIIIWEPNVGQEFYAYFIHVCGKKADRKVSGEIFESKPARVMTMLSLRYFLFKHTTATTARPTVCAPAFLNFLLISTSNVWNFSFRFREIVGADHRRRSTQRKKSVKVSSHCLHGGNFVISKIP